MRRLIRVDGTTEDFDKPIKSIGECSALIGADTLDTVTLRHLGYPTTVMLVDDSSVHKGLPVNAEATRLYLANCLPNTAHKIRGDVLVVPDDDFL